MTLIDGVIVDRGSSFAADVVVVEGVRLVQVVEPDGAIYGKWLLLVDAGITAGEVGLPVRIVAADDR